MRPESEAVQAVEKYGDMVRRICFLHLKNQQDAEDIFQDVFLKYLLYNKPFQDESHVKAWLIRVAINSCKDTLKSFFRKKVSTIEGMQLGADAAEASDRWVLDIIFQMPERYRNVIYLHYYEGYSAVEIAKILRQKENTIYTWLARGRKMLKEDLGGEMGG